MAATTLVSTIELTNLLGIHRNTVHEWVAQGCPTAVRAKVGDRGGHKFLLSDVLEWHKSRAVIQATGSNELMSADEAKRRKLMAEAGLQEIELNKRKGDVIELAEVEKKLSNTFAVIRSNMLKVSDRTAIRLIGETDETRIKKIIREEINQALDALSTWNTYEDEVQDDE